MMKIAVTGPESVGKSTLSIQLAEHFKGVFVKEFARDYVVQLSRKYTFQDVEQIARKQIEEYDQIVSEVHTDYVFFDTFLIITKVWFLYVWGHYPAWLDDAIVTRRMDLYLLCEPDIPWSDDGVRENGKIREELFACYESQLKLFGLRYEVVRGFGNERLMNAIEKVNLLK